MEGISFKFPVIFFSLFLVICGCKQREESPQENSEAKEYIVRKKITIKADRMKVWDALTNPDKTKRYFYNCEVRSDWKPGSPIIFEGQMEGKPLELKGEIIAVEPGTLLKYRLNHHSETAAANVRGYSIVTDFLQEGDSPGETVLQIVDDIGSEEGFEKSEKGWDMVLTGLKQLVEAENMNP